MPQSYAQGYAGVSFIRANIFIHLPIPLPRRAHTSERRVAVARTPRPSPRPSPAPPRFPKTRKPKCSFPPAAATTRAVVPGVAQALAAPAPAATLAAAPVAAPALAGAPAPVAAAAEEAAALTARAARRHTAGRPSGSSPSPSAVSAHSWPWSPSWRAGAAADAPRRPRSWTSTGGSPWAPARSTSGAGTSAPTTRRRRPSPSRGLCRWRPAASSRTRAPNPPRCGRRGRTRTHRRRRGAARRSRPSGRRRPWRRGSWRAGRRRWDREPRWTTTSMRWTTTSMRVVNRLSPQKYGRALNRINDFRHRPGHRRDDQQCNLSLFQCIIYLGIHTPQGPDLSPFSIPKLCDFICICVAIKFTHFLRAVAVPSFCEFIKRISSACVFFKKICMSS